MHRLKGVVALVTGGASGYGLATVERLCKVGANVVICDLKNSKGQEVASKTGENSIFVPTDVTSEDEVKNALNVTTDKFKKLDLLVNCAGINVLEKTYDFRNEEPHSLEKFSNMLKINTGGTFNTIRLAAGIMGKNKPDEEGQRGVIVNLTSIHAFEGSVGHVAFAASSGCIVSMTLPIARDLATEGIRCCAIAPGLCLDIIMGKNKPDEEGQRGVIVNLTSIHAFEGSVGHLAFAASSGCIVSMTLPIARDLATEGIRCCAIAPGLFDTPFFRSLPEKYKRFLPSVVPFPKGLGNPDEFAHLVQTIYENKMLNGEVIRLDGALRFEM